MIHQVDTITGEQVKQTANTFKDMDSTAVGSVAVGIIPILPPDDSGKHADDSGLDDVFYSFGAEVYSLYVVGRRGVGTGCQSASPIAFVVSLRLLRQPQPAAVALDSP